jgi:hypothetical protein
VPKPSVDAQIWAESPFQLLSAVEAQHAGRLGPSTDVTLRAGLAPLTTTAAEIERLGPPAGLRPHTVDLRPPRPSGPVRLVIGDAFSGAVQRRLAGARDPQLVIVDDGLATVHLLELLTARNLRPLVRARVPAAVSRRALGLATAARLRAAARAGRLTFCTALPIEPDLAAAVRALGARLARHDFPWLRTRPADPIPHERLVVLGTSLVGNGLVHREPYLAWIRSLVATEPLTYRPHRREDPAVLAELARIPGITITSANLPAEICLRGLTADHHVLSLPSTALTTLRLVLRGNGTTIEGVNVPAAWWTSAADPSLRAHLSLFLGGMELAT